MDAPNFIIVSEADPVSCLCRAFPELENELDHGDRGSCYAYARFADYLASHRGDEQLWRRTYSFFESLAAGGGSLAEIPVVGVFEPWCVDVVLAEHIRDNLGPLARKLFDEMKSFRGPTVPTQRNSLPGASHG